MGSGVGAILVFCFGIAAGVLIAFAGAGFLEQSAGTILSVFLGTLMLALVAGVILFAARRPIWKRLFGFAEVQLASFAEPLAKVAERAIERDPTGATQAARDLVSMVLARYSWITARRWLIASLTGLIAAMAALAGTALLFRQNQLLEAQSGLFQEQNQKINEQTLLLVQSVELAEAARNASLAVEITEIADTLGQAVTRVNGAEGLNFVNALNVQTDLDRGLILRITSISRALKPYRFLDTGMRPGDPSDKFRMAMQGRRADLPDTYDRIAGYNGWTDPLTQTRLIDRPASPERGQLLNTLITGGVRDLEALNTAGLDLSFAHLPEAEMGNFSAQVGRLSYVDFTGASLASFDLGGANLENARFVRSRLDRGNFSTLTADRMKWPLRTTDAPFDAFLTGADFTDAVIQDSSFAGAWMLASRFDGAIVKNVSFAGTDLGTATFRGTLILQADFTGASLKSVDFEGAVVFGADAIEELAAAAYPESFVASAWELQPVTVEDLMGRAVIANSVGVDDFAKAMQAGEPFRLHRVGGPLR